MLYALVEKMATCCVARLLYDALPGIDDKVAEIYPTETSSAPRYLATWKKSKDKDAYSILEQDRSVTTSSVTAISPHAVQKLWWVSQSIYQTQKIKPSWVFELLRELNPVKR